MVPKLLQYQLMVFTELSSTNSDVLCILQILQNIAATYPDVFLTLHPVHLVWISIY